MLNRLLSLIQTLLNFNKISHKGFCVSEENQEIILVFNHTPPSVLTETLKRCEVQHDIEDNTLFIYFN